MAAYTKETLGIIGGCGVAAANELACRIEKRLTELGCLDDAQQPELILFQATQAPNRIAFAAGKSSVSFAPYFIEVGRKLKTCGATICCIPCNTAHCVIGEIEHAVGLPFVDIVNETLFFIFKKSPEAKKIGLLCSAGTRSSQIYQKHSRSLGYHLEFLFPKENLQQSVSDGIAAVKRGLQYVSSEKVKAFFTGAMDDLISKGSDVIVLGCTEIPLAVSDKYYKNKPVADSLSILAEACINRCKTTETS
ncbi:MAG: amino acid racemase [Puniceicoccales bacterium]|jgi:aspartate racemase|nr:amino acid racemase [Puniceicoccales bacterium]